MKTKQNKQYGSQLTNLFEPYSETSKKLGFLFTGNLDVLNQAYFAAQDVDKSIDHEGNVFGSPFLMGNIYAAGSKILSRRLFRLR
jgi:hypothetical protein